MNLLFWYRSLMRSVGATLVKLIATATSGLVSFTTNVIRPVKVTCEFSPIQEGTGDPSPYNGRPISGWTGCEIGHTGKNLFDGTVTNARIQNGEVVATGSYRLSGYIKANPDTSYALVDKDGNLCQIFSHFFDENKTHLQSISSTDGVVVSPAGASYMRFHVTARSFGDQKPYMLFEGSTATAYEPYQGETIPITFTDPTTGDPMTVYGGTLTLNEDGSGELAVEREKQSFSSSQGFSVYGSNQNVTVFRKTSAISKTPTAEQISNIAVYDKNAFSTAGNPNVFQIGSTGNLFLKLSTSEASTTTELNALLSETPLDVVFKVGFPTTYNLTAEQVNSLIGANTIWHNMNGDITVEYWNKQ